MISDFELVNYEGHVDTSFQFVPGLNVITGKSDEGKSSLVRALRWNIRNEASNDPLNWDASKKADCSVLCGIDDIKIQRIKNTARNGYDIIRPNKTDPLNAVGRNLPDVIESLYNMGDINFQIQKDAYYLLNTSPGKAAKHFNEIMGLEVIDESLSNINALIKATNNKIGFVTNEIKTKQEELQTYDWIEQAIKIQKRAIAIQENVNTIRKDIQNLSKLKTTIETARKQLAAYDGLDSVETMVNECISIKEQRDKVCAEMRALDSLLDNMDSTKKAIARLNHEIETQQLQYEKIMPETCPLCERSGK